VDTVFAHYAQFGNNYDHNSVRYTELPISQLAFEGLGIEAYHSHPTFDAGSSSFLFLSGAVETDNPEISVRFRTQWVTSGHKTYAHWNKTTEPALTQILYC
jgi:hypothetical protein